jgi:hypothetical protein
MSQVQGQDIAGVRKVNGRLSPRPSAKELIRGRELDLLNHFGVAWPAQGKTHMCCPFSDHPDDNPSWRWDSSEARWFCTCGSGDVIDAVQRLNGWDYVEACDYIETVFPGAGAANFPFKGKSAQAPETNRNARLAARVWKDAGPVADQAATYLATRGIALDAWPEAIRFAPSLPHTQPGSGERSTHPALIAGLSKAPGGEIEAVGRAWLAPDGSGKADIKPNRQVLGSTKGLACWLGRPSARLVIGEGVEDASSFLDSGRVVRLCVNGRGQPPEHRASRLRD